MTKKKIIIIIAATLALILVALAIVALVHYYRSAFRPHINDTLPDGNGKSARVILLAGQSNASGCSSDAYLQKNIDAEQYEKFKNGFDNVYINYYVSGNNESEEFVKCAVNQGESGGYFGPELGMARTFSECYPEDTIFIIKFAYF